MSRRGRKPLIQRIAPYVALFLAVTLVLSLIASACNPNAGF